MTTTIHGRVGGTSNGFEVNLTSSGDGLEGRIGGTFVGSNVDLQFQSGQVSGRVGGQVVGFDITGSLSPSAIQLRFGGETLGETLNLAIDGGVVTGRFSGPVAGKDVRLKGLDGGITGRIGGEFEGKDVRLSGSAPLEVMTLAALIAFKILEGQNHAAAVSNGVHESEWMASVGGVRDGFCADRGSDHGDVAIRVCARDGGSQGHAEPVKFFNAARPRVSINVPVVYSRRVFQLEPGFCRDTSDGATERLGDPSAQTCRIKRFCERGVRSLKMAAEKLGQRRYFG